MSNKLSFSKNFERSNVFMKPPCLDSSLTFFHVLIVVRCSVHDAFGTPPIWMLGQDLMIFSFICLVTNASHSFASQYLEWMYLIMFKSRALPFLFHMAINHVIRNTPSIVSMLIVLFVYQYIASLNKSLVLFFNYLQLLLTGRQTD